MKPLILIICPNIKAHLSKLHLRYIIRPDGVWVDEPKEDDYWRTRVKFPKHEIFVVEAPCKHCNYRLED